MSFKLRGNWNSEKKNPTEISKSSIISNSIVTLDNDIIVENTTVNNQEREILEFKHFFNPSKEVEIYNEVFFTFPLQDCSKIKIVITGLFEAETVITFKNKEAETNSYEYIIDSEGLTKKSFTTLTLQTLNLYELSCKKLDSELSEIYSIELYKIKHR